MTRSPFQEKMLYYMSRSPKDMPSSFLTNEATSFKKEDNTLLLMWLSGAFGKVYQKRALAILKQPNTNVMEHIKLAQPYILEHEVQEGDWKGLTTLLQSLTFVFDTWRQYNKK
jgi:hypothetical protein